MKHPEALALAERLKVLLAGACEQIEVAGSIRRGKETVKDIELVARPKVLQAASTDLFGDTELVEVSLLDGLLTKLVTQGDLVWDPVVKRNGPKYKRLSQVFGVDIALDLFLADSDNFGNVFTIRTGDGDFSRILMTPRGRGGLMPMGMKQEGGYLWQRATMKICCPTERAYFAALGVPFVAPAERNAATANHLMQRPPTWEPRSVR